MKNMLFVLFLLVGSTAFAQDAQQAAKPVGNEPLLNQVTNLNSLANDVNTAQAAVKASAVQARAKAVEANAAFSAACNNYRDALKKELASATDAELINALNRELAAVELLINPAPAPQQR